MMHRFLPTLTSESAMASSIQITQHDGVRELLLNRPQLHNAFDDALIAELSDALKSAAEDDAVRILMLRGAGASFSAGADLNWMRGMAGASEADNRADSLRLAALMRCLQFFPKPTLARVHGAAFGGGVGLVTCCDIAIGARSARFGLTETKLGLVPAVISPYVIAAIGLRQARRLFLTGETFDADTAQKIGLLHQVVDDDALDAAIERVVHLLLKAGPQAQREAKQLALRTAGITPLQAEHLDHENALLIARLRVSSEGQEGLGAFLEKRAPLWATDAT